MDILQFGYIFKVINSFQDDMLPVFALEREFVHTLGRVVAKPTHQCVCAVATRRNTQN